MVEEHNSKEVLEQKLLPIWSKKQKEIEEYIETVEVSWIKSFDLFNFKFFLWFILFKTEFDELNQLINKELNAVFKYLQGVSHIWDIHELGLVKKERALQELLQDCRKDHDGDNQKREEKLDSILDQMRESSTEKDLKRLMTNVGLQLDAIKRGYMAFKDAQIELVKQYPEMVKEELKKYEESVYKFFSIIPPSKSMNMEQNKKDEPVDSLRHILKEVLNTDKGTKFYVTLRSDASEGNEENGSDILNYDELIPNTKLEILNNIDYKTHLKHAYIPLVSMKEIKNWWGS